MINATVFYTLSFHRCDKDDDDVRDQHLGPSPCEFCNSIVLVFTVCMRARLDRTHC